MLNGLILEPYKRKETAKKCDLSSTLRRNLEEFFRRNVPRIFIMKEKAGREGG